MSEIRFYQLSRSSLASALSGILAKALERSMRAVVAAGSAELAEKVSADLWTEDPSGFLPHGTEKDGESAMQPVFIGAGEENPNGAKLLITLEGAEPASPDAFELCCIVFAGSDDAALGRALAAWKTLKEAGHVLSYWQQDDAGRWQKTA